MLFNDYKQYRQFADKLSPGLASASGFWSGGQQHRRVLRPRHERRVQDRWSRSPRSLQDRKEEAVRTRAANAADTRPHWPTR